ncbi:hypothetical protein DdX_21298 [Ditylenchus destructor]|uniref:Uncharacterized protein n=1 Tax=Ditylenchus destructor TaxID=166010 RepID=A0AAD4MF60_9BILA|nr:hypothetical protein DdX_21298 [Ditylenchus destructor]
MIHRVAAVAAREAVLVQIAALDRQQLAGLPVHPDHVAHPAFMAADQAEVALAERKRRLDLRAQTIAGIVAVRTRPMLEPHPARQLERTGIAGQPSWTRNRSSVRRDALGYFMRNAAGELDLVQAARIVAEAVDRFEFDVGGIGHRDLGGTRDPQFAVVILCHRGRQAAATTGKHKSEGVTSVDPGYALTAFR